MIRTHIGGEEKGKPRERPCGAGSRRGCHDGEENGGWRAGGSHAPGQERSAGRASVWQPTNPRCSNRAEQSVGGCAIVAYSLDRSRWRPTPRSGPHPPANSSGHGRTAPDAATPTLGPTATGTRLAAPTGLSVKDLHPRGRAGGCASRRLLIGEASEPAQMAPVGAGRIASTGERQQLAGSGGHGGFQGRRAEANPRLPVSGAGLQHHAGVMTFRAHGGDHRGSATSFIPQPGFAFGGPTGDNEGITSKPSVCASSGCQRH